MAIAIFIFYILVGLGELALWREKPWPKVLVYLSFLGAAALLAVLITVNLDLQVPSPLAALIRLFERLYKGGAH